MAQENVKYLGLYVQIVTEACMKSAVQNIIVTGACMESAVQSISVPRHMFGASCNVLKIMQFFETLIQK
jgi:hypothetical protein